MHTLNPLIVSPPLSAVPLHFFLRTDGCTDRSRHQNHHHRTRLPTSTKLTLRLRLIIASPTVTYLRQRVVRHGPYPNHSSESFRTLKRGWITRNGGGVGGRYLASREASCVFDVCLAIATASDARQLTRVDRHHSPNLARICAARLRP